MTQSAVISAAVVMLLSTLPTTPLVAQSSFEVAPAVRRMALQPLPRTFVPRYLLTEMRSEMTASGNLGTVLRITNMSGAKCSYAVEFYYSLGGTKPADKLACSIQVPGIRNFDTAIICSRGMGPATTASCIHVCAASLGVSGKAVIYSDGAVEGCDRMAINASVIKSTVNDTGFVGIYTPKLVKYDIADVMQSNKGD